MGIDGMWDQLVGWLKKRKERRQPDDEIIDLVEDGDGVYQEGASAPAKEGFSKKPARVAMLLLALAVVSALYLLLVDAPVDDVPEPEQEVASETVEAEKKTEEVESSRSFLWEFGEYPEFPNERGVGEYAQYAMGAVRYPPMWVWIAAFLFLRFFSAGTFELLARVLGVRKSPKDDPEYYFNQYKRGLARRRRLPYWGFALMVALMFFGAYLALPQTTIEWLKAYSATVLLMVVLPIVVLVIGAYVNSVTRRDAAGIFSIGVAAILFILGTFTWITS